MPHRRRTAPASLTSLLVTLAALSGCGGGADDELPGPLVATDSYRLDSGHFMQGAVLPHDYLVGLSFNGLASLDRDTWKYRLFPEARCGRLVAGTDRVYCTHHDRLLQVIAWSPDTRRVTGITPVNLDEPASLEGMALWKDHLYVAARGGGLRRFGLDGSGGQEVVLPNSLGEVWDIAPLDDERAVLALGRDGIAVLDFSVPDRVLLLARLALPGVAVSVHVTGSTAWVATLSGGGHAVDLTDPSAPRRSGTLVTGGLVYDMRPVGSLVVASSGYHQVTARHDGDRLSVIGVRTSSSWALSTVDADGQLYSAEFGIAARFTIDPQHAAGPYLRPSPGALSPRQGSLTVSLPLANLGDAPLAVDAVRVLAVGSDAERARGGPFVVPAGGTHFVELPVAAEPLRVKVDAPGNLGSATHFEIRQTKGLQPGDRLPSPLAWLDRNRRLHDVSAAMSGKVGFLMIGASSCPVAFYGLHASRADLAELVRAGSVAAFSVDPWDNADHGDMEGLDEVFPHLLSPLNSADGHDHSEVMDVLGQDTHTGPPMPITYVVGRDGVIRFAQWGYEPVAVQRALAEALAAR